MLVSEIGEESKFAGLASDFWVVTMVEVSVTVDTFCEEIVYSIVAPIAIATTIRAAIRVANPSFKTGSYSDFSAVLFESA